MAPLEQARYSEFVHLPNVVGSGFSLPLTVVRRTTPIGVVAPTLATDHCFVMEASTAPEHAFRLWIIAVASFGAALGLVACGTGTSTVEEPEDAVAAGATVASSTDSEISVLVLVPLLTRYGVGPNQVGIDLTFASQLFFDVTGLQIPAEALSQPTLVFIMQENIHEGDFLSDEPSAVFLLQSDGTQLAPYLTVVTAEDPHHRVVRLLFPMLEESDRVRLVVPFGDGTVSVANTFIWELPIELDGTAAAQEG